MEKKIENNNFFTKKKYIFISVLVILVIALIVLTVFFVLDVNWGDLWKYFSLSATTDKLFALWIIIFLLFIIYKIGFVMYMFYIRLKRLKVQVKFYDYLLYSLTIAFLQMISPFGVLTDPYSIFWLKTKGLSTYQSACLTTSYAFVAHISQLLITLPSFIIISINYPIITSNEAGMAIYWFIILGLSIDLITLISLIIVGYSAHVHFAISLFWNKCKKIIRLPYHTKEETREKYLVQADFKKLFKKNIRDVWVTVNTVIVIMVSEFFLYAIIYPCLSLVSSQQITIDFWASFNCINVAVTANKMIPIPGGIMSLDFSIKTLLENSNAIHLNDSTAESIETISGNGTFVWRFISGILPAILGFFGFVWVTIKHFKDYKTSKTVFIN